MRGPKIDLQDLEWCYSSLLKKIKQIEKNVLSPVESLGAQTFIDLIGDDTDADFIRRVMYLPTGEDSGALRVL